MRRRPQRSLAPEGDPRVVDAARLLADLAAFWEHPRPGRFDGQIPRRLAGGPSDQPIPAGIRNPYWEIIRQLPLNESLWGATPEPDGFALLSYAAPCPGCTSSGVRKETAGCKHCHGRGLTMAPFPERRDLCMTFAWSILSPGDVAWMKERLAGRGLVEIGAGKGYWADQLMQAGVDVVAYDPCEVSESKYAVGDPWFPVVSGAAEAAAAHPDRALTLCWPSYNEPWAQQALSTYAGSQLFYAGEGAGGCCADDAFFEALEAEWEEIETCPHHITYSGIHCHLTEYRRKERRRP